MDPSAGSRPGGPSCHILPSLCVEMCYPAVLPRWWLEARQTPLAVAGLACGLPSRGSASLALSREGQHITHHHGRKLVRQHREAASSYRFPIVSVQFNVVIHHGLANTCASSSTPGQAPLHRSKSCNCLKQDSRRRSTTTTSAEPDTSRDTG